MSAVTSHRAEGSNISIKLSKKIYGSYNNIMRHAETVASRTMFILLYIIRVWYNKFYKVYT